MEIIFTTEWFQIDEKLNIQAVEKMQMFQHSLLKIFGTKNIDTEAVKQDGFDINLFLLSYVRIRNSSYLLLNKMRTLEKFDMITFEKKKVL